MRHILVINDTLHFEFFKKELLVFCYLIVWLIVKFIVQNKWLVICVIWKSRKVFIVDHLCLCLYTFWSITIVLGFSQCDLACV